jgi:flagellar hook-associated protein 2
MAGIQISNLLSDSAFDWKSVVDQLIAADTIPVTKLQTEQTTNKSQVTALSDLQTLMDTLQNSASALRDSNLFAARSVSTTSTTSTWKSVSSTGAAIGTYTFAVQHLATKARITGTADVGAGLSPTDVVTGATIANLNVPTAVTAGNFTVNGKQVSVALTDSLQDVFDKISTATGGDVTASYDHTTDKITLTSASTIVLSAGNDTSNFLSVMKLGNNGGSPIISASALGTLKLNSAIAASGLKATTPIAGAFKINGVTINFDPATDSFATLLSRINTSGAGVTASYDSANDRFQLTNSSTGDIGIGLDDNGSGMLAAMGLSSAGFVAGTNAQFTVNGGPTMTSMSNTLDASAHGITGLSVSVNTETTQTIDVASDVSGMQTAIQTFVDNYNAVQDSIATNTKVTSSGGTVTTSVLSGNREVDAWAKKLRSLAFESVSGLTGTINRLDNLGVDFDVDGKMVVKSADKMTAALSDHPDDVQAFFQTAGTGFVAKQFNYLTSIISADLKQQSNLNQANSKLDDQIKTLQARLATERDTLTNAFIRMLDAQSAAKDQSTALTNAFSTKSSS